MELLGQWILSDFVIWKFSSCQCVLSPAVYEFLFQIFDQTLRFLPLGWMQKKKKFSVVTVLLWMWASFYIESHSCFFPTKIVYWCYLLVFLLYWFFFLVIRSNWSVTFFFFLISYFIRNTFPTPGLFKERNSFRNFVFF